MFLVVVVGIVVGAAVVAGGGDGESPTESPRPVEEASVPHEAASGQAALQALDDVLGEIDRAERAMIQFQRTASRPGGPSPDGAAAVARAAEQARDELEDIRGQLTAPELAGEDLAPVRATRDSYVRHLDAWTDHLGEVADDPSVELAPTPDPDTFDDINRTARRFADRLRTVVPPDAPDELRSLAQLILQRGFAPSRSGTPGGQLV